MRSQIIGVDVVVEGIRDMSLGVQKAAMQGVINGLQVAFREADKIISADDHSLKDLAELGNPYSKAHPQSIHTPDETVHIQGGDYERALKVEKPVSYSDGAIIEGQVHIDASKLGEDPESLDEWIQGGTKTMRARAWAERVTTDHGEEIAEAIEAPIRAAMDAAGLG